MRTSYFVHAAAVLAFTAALPRIAWAADWLGGEPCDQCECEVDDCCEPPGTLMQWSYGTSFEGGPPGFDEPLASDRPDFTEASTTVGRGVAQVEMGYTYFEDREGGVSRREHSYPEMLWRIGMFAEWFEWRIAYNHATAFERVGAGPETEFSGSEDLYLGIKLALTPQEGILPEMAIMPQMTVPSGDPEFTADIVLPGLSWLYSWEVVEGFGIGGSTQANRAVDDLGEVYTEVAQSLTAAVDITEKLGGYVEWFVFAPSGSDVAQTEHYFNGGFAYSVTNSLQLDVRAGMGLNDAAFDFFSGAGVVVRF